MANARKLLWTVFFGILFFFSIPYFLLSYVNQTVELSAADNISTALLDQHKDVWRGTAYSCEDNGEIAI